MTAIIPRTNIIKKDKSMTGETNNERMNVRLDRNIDP